MVTTSSQGLILLTQGLIIDYYDLQRICNNDDQDKLMMFNVIEYVMMSDSRQYMAMRCLVHVRNAHGMMLGTGPGYFDGYHDV